MQIHLLIGPTEVGSARFRTILKKKAMLLEKHSIYSPDWNHIRAYMACADPDAIGVIRFKRGFMAEKAQKALYAEIEMQLSRALERVDAKHMILSSGQYGAMLSNREELQRLRDLLKSFSDDIRITAHVDEQARLLAEYYCNRVMEGRRYSLDLELELARGDDWWGDALAMRGQNEPYFGLFNDVQYPPFWLDYARLIDHWEGVFGAGTVTLRPLLESGIMGEDGANEVNSLLGVDLPLGKLDAERPDEVQSAASVARVRQFNDLIIRYMQARDIFCPRDIWRLLKDELLIPGSNIPPGSLHPVSEHFAADNARLMTQFPALADGCLAPDDPQATWEEADTERGFRASQYLAAYSHRIRTNSESLTDKLAEDAAVKQTASKFDGILAEASDTEAEAAARKKLVNMVEVNHQIVLSTAIRPHNDMGAVQEDAPAEPYAQMPLRDLPDGNSGNVIVGCMKNEAPYIIEWVAYHRAIGVDNFLIYTNDCTDGTDEILGRLQDMGILQHRNNDNWRGNSPQQHALNEALKEPVIQNAEWIIHIDVDEFMNVRTGNGTLQDLFARVPDATNFAMTWRLFGHNGITQLEDQFVIDQFDTCAPKFCPKPHTVWGFKTMFKNIGAYGKLSCHRPNKLSEDFEQKVKWVNGSGRDMTQEVARNGWRNSKKSIGYDLLQLNHYALRSAESFLIKRQRGRALHVDRSIGLNYWIRMDWSDFKDVTIKRNLPRLKAEYDRLMEDSQLRALHQSGLEWHRAKVSELHDTPEFAELYSKALGIKLSESERVAYALALDMES